MRTPLVQNRSLIASGRPSSGRASPRAIRRSASAAIASACSGVSVMKALSARARAIAARWASTSSFAENALAARPSRAAARLCAASPLIRRPSARRNSRPRARARSLRMSSARPPSVTSSARSASFIATTEVIGGTPAVSTSFSCSIHSRMRDSSPASGASSVSGTAIRASRATRATVASSSDIWHGLPRAAGAAPSCRPAQKRGGSYTG